MPMTLLRNLLTFWIASLALSAWAHDFKSAPGPSMVFVTQSGCYFCDRLDEQVISPIQASGFFTDQGVELVRLSIDPGQQVVNFAGQRQSAMAFASEYGAFGTPTLLFFDSNGRLATAPLYGVPDAIDFYGAKIEQTVAELN